MTVVGCNVPRSTGTKRSCVISQAKIRVAANFDEQAQLMNFDTLGQMGFPQHKIITDSYSGKRLSRLDERIVIPLLSFYWLSE
ncbi:MAG: hypothetical protein Q8K59_10640 [Nitrosomonas sp.]|nr:hypothetical protein [Nitrosomonas sp.]MDP1951529.1 hypothetical protein [Nitrosomonas sp.]